MEPADAATLRKRADARFKAGDPAGAAEAYGLLLSTGQLSPSERVSLLSNRAAARLMAGELEAAVQDCNEGLVVLLEGLGLDLSRKLHAWVADRLLQQQGEAEQLPPGWGAGEAKRSSLQRLLARRGAAYGHLRLYKESADDLSSAAAVCRSSGDDGPAVALEADAERVRGLIPPPAAARREPADCAEEGLERLD